MPGEASYYAPDEATAASREKQSALNKRLEARRQASGVDTTTGAYQTTRNFLKDYHDKVVAMRAEGRGTDSKGVPYGITMMSSGIGYKGKEYVLPSYNPMTGEVENDSRKVLDRFLHLIESGDIKGFSSPEEGEAAARLIREEILSGDLGASRMKPRLVGAQRASTDIDTPRDLHR